MWVVIFIQVVRRAGLCIEADYVTPLSIRDAARASLQNHRHKNNKRKLALIFRDHRERGWAGPSSLLHSFSFRALFVHHLLLLRPLLHAQSAGQSAATPMTEAYSLTPILLFLPLLFFFKFLWRLGKHRPTHFVFSWRLRLVVLKKKYHFINGLLHVTFFTSEALAYSFDIFRLLRSKIFSQ